MRQHVPPQPYQTSQDSTRHAHQQVVLTLGVVHHRHAAKAEHLVHLLHLVSKNLLNLHKQMHKEAVAIAGECYNIG
jgi:hypothetical protein